MDAGRSTSERARGAAWLALVVSALVLPAGACGETWLVQDGQPRAQIVIAEQPPRMVQLAANELQTYVQRISGAQLPIVTAPIADQIAIFVGRSAHTDKLGISDEGLNDGAFRMVSGDRWLALVGRDTDFVPREPWAPHHGHMGRMFAEWDKITGTHWGNPVGTNLQRHYSKTLKLWSYDERGSLNAVYALLRDLGVRWYMPGELGEIVPKAGNIALPRVDRVVKPDFGLRYFAFATFFFEDAESIMWYLRMGLNSHSSAVGPTYIHSHGMAEVHNRPEFAQAHPDYYALWGGQRMISGGTNYGGKPCLSSQGLFEENVRYLRVMFDHYDIPMGSVFPEDGYSSLCGCPLCEGKGTPERGWTGGISDYVWEYADRVARELYKTHPDRKISCFAYGSYLKPPTKIDKLSPNLVVGIVQPRRLFHDRKKREENEAMRAAWLAKMSSGQLLIWDHYPFTAPGMPSHGLPQYFPHQIAEDLRSLKGISLGEIVEVGFDLKRNLALHAPVFNHLNLYVTARLYWDADQDVDALLDEYYASFYGPAAREMKTFVEYCQANIVKLRTDANAVAEMLTLAQAVQEKVDAQSVYGQRIEQLIAYLQPMRQLQEQLAKGRENVPEARAAQVPVASGDIVLDGKFDDKAWQEHKGGTYGLLELETGQPPTFGTTFRMIWANNSLYVAIRCADPDTRTLNIGTTKSNDPAIFNGDAIELMIETQGHSYYQIVVNPAGALIDLDRISGINSDWSSLAEVATHVGEGYWSVEMRLPIADPEGGQLDPLHNVVGVKPTPQLPWFFNLCRQRVRETGMERSAFSPTGADNFHVLLKFAKLYAW